MAWRFLCSLLLAFSTWQPPYWAGVYVNDVDIKGCSYPHQPRLRLSPATLTPHEINELMLPREIRRADQRSYSSNALIVGETGAGKSSAINPITGEQPQEITADNPPPSEIQRRYTPNVLVVGETGVGKSSVINLIAGEPLAAVHSGTGGCAMDATSYDVILSDDQHQQNVNILSYVCWNFVGLGVVESHHVRLFDIVGLDEPQFGKSDYLSAIEKANTLICQLQRMGGIRLLLFCMRGGRITTVTRNNYRLFCEILCQNQVPVALVITGLENEPSMEGWWERNASLFEACQLSCVSHACVTAARGFKNCYAGRYRESQMMIRAMLLGHVTGSGTSWQPERTDWFVHMAGKLLVWLSQMKKHRRSLTVEELAHHLRDRCKFSRSEAVHLANKIWAEGLGNAGPNFVKSDDVSD